jgi:hypothetical protein
MVEDKEIKVMIANRRKWLLKNGIQDWNDTDTVFVAEKCAEKMYKKLEQIHEQLLVNEQMRFLLNTKFTENDFSYRTRTCLKNGDIETVGDLVQCNKLELRKIRNLGSRSLAELEDFVQKKGLIFGMNVEKYQQKSLTEILGMKKNFLTFFTEVLDNELTEITDEDAKDFADSFPNKENPLHIMAVFRGQPEYKKGPDLKKIKWYLSSTTHYLFLKSKGYNVEKYL